MAMTLAEIQDPNQYSPALAQGICGRFLSPCRQVDCDKYVYQQISFLVDLWRLLSKVGLDKDVYFTILDSECP